MLTSCDPAGCGRVLQAGPSAVREVRVQGTRGGPDPEPAFAGWPAGAADLLDAAAVDGGGWLRQRMVHRRHLVGLKLADDVVVRLLQHR